MPYSSPAPSGAGFSRLTDLLPTALDPRDSKQSGLLQNANADRNIRTALAFGGKEGSGKPSGATTAASSVSNAANGFAEYLADTLGDAEHHNIAFYRLVCRTVPRDLILDALQRAKDAQNVRRSRAALFTFLIRHHLPKR